MRKLFLRGNTDFTLTHCISNKTYTVAQMLKLQSIVTEFSYLVSHFRTWCRTGKKGSSQDWVISLSPIGHGWQRLGEVPSHHAHPVCLVISQLSTSFTEMEKMESHIWLTWRVINLVLITIQRCWNCGCCDICTEIRSSATQSVGKDKKNSSFQEFRVQSCNKLECNHHTFSVTFF